MTGQIKLSIWTNGDSSVGINGDQAEVVLNVGDLDPEDLQAHVMQAKELLGSAFSELWDTKAYVAMESELEGRE